MSHPPVQRERLPGGLTVLLCPAHRAPVAEFQLWAGAGSADEGPGEAGVAHFHEHMLFKGTARRGVGEVAGEVEGAGGRINAYTSYDVTVYHATMPSERLSVGIDVLCDAVLHPAFDAEEIRREIEVVLEEIRRSDDSPSSVLGNAVFADAYRVHPYRSPILGTAESVAAFDRERVRAFYERWYAPDNLVAVVAGDFEREAVLADLRRAFDGAATRAPRRRRPAEPEQTSPRASVLVRPFERTSCQLAWPGMGLGHPDAPLLDLLAFVLGGCESSRLVRRVKERDALVERIDAWAYSPLDPGVFSVDLETDAGRTLEAIGAAVREVERLRAELVGEEELEKARANFLAAEHFERESVSGIAAKIGGFHLTAGGFQAEGRYLDTLRRATPADLRRVAATYLVPQRLTVGTLLPEADAAALDAAAVEQVAARAVERTARVFAGARGVGGRPPQRASYELPCGAALHVVPRRDVPVVAARAAFLGGLLAESERTSGTTAFLTSMWLRGTESHSAAGFADAAESRAAEIDAFAGRNSFGLTLEVPSGQLDPALDLFVEVLLEPAFDGEEVERERRETLAAIARREDRLAQRAFQLFAAQLYRRHPYRMPTLGSAEVVSALDADALRAHHGRFVKAHNLVVAVAGDVDPDAVADRLAGRLADLDATPFERPEPPADDPPREIRRAELRKERAQAHLVIGFAGVCVDDDDRFALEVIAQLLAGQGGRMFIELRDRQGLAYAVNAVSIEGLAPGYFALYAATAPDKLDAAREGLLAELRALKARPPGADEIERARRYLTGSFAIDQQRCAVHAAQTSLNALYGLGPDAHHRYAERIGAVEPEDVLRVARRLFDLDAYVEAVVRP